LKKKNEECFEEKIDTNLYGYKSPWHKERSRKFFCPKEQTSWMA
jgi:hypothetical protein